MTIRIILLALIVSINGVAQDIQSLYSELNKSVVTILIKEKQIVSDSEENVRMVTSEGLGSGVYVKDDGTILTASHVVNNAESIMVLFSNGEKAPAKVQAISVSADLAVIKTIYKPNNEIPVAKLGSSADVKVGEKIMVIGAPYGLIHSLSVGYISGRRSEKSLVTGMTKVEFLQTDASINHGNSGGPMFNMKGEVIGIVSHILSESGGFEGLGFASSVDLSKRLLDHESGKWFGLDAILLDESLSKALNVPTGGGLLIQRVVRSSPAGSAGLKGGTIVANLLGKEVILGGDIITSVQGLSISTEESLEKVTIMLDETPKGETIKVVLLREGKEVTIDMLKP